MTENQKLNSFMQHWFGWVVCGLGAIFYAYEYLLRIIPSVIMDDLVLNYSIGAEKFGLLAAFYYYAYTPMQLPVGVMMDRFGPRRLLTVAALMCVLGSYLFVGTGPEHFYIACAGRFLMGLGSAFAFVGVLKLATIWLPEDHFAFVSGLATMLGMLGAFAGDNILRFLVSKHDWVYSIHFFTVVGLVVAGSLWAIVRDGSERYHHTVEKTQTLSEGLHGLTDLLKNRYIWIVGAVGSFLFLSLSVFGELWGIPYFETVHELAKDDAAKINSFLFLGWAFGGPFSGWLSDLIGQRRVLLRYGSLVACALSIIILYVPGLHIGMLYLTVFLFGVACSTQIVIFAIATEIAPRKFAGTALALVNMLVMVGGMILQPLFGTMLEMLWDGTIVQAGIPAYSKEAYQQAFSVLPIALFSVYFLAKGLPKTRMKREG